MAKNRTVWCDRGWQPVYFGFCPNKKAWKREMKRFSIEMPYPESDGRTTWLRNDDGNDCAIVTISDRFQLDGHCHNGVACLLVHEAMHIWRGIRESIGESEPSAEFEAYAMQNISLQLIDAFCDSRFDLFRKPVEPAAP